MRIVETHPDGSPKLILATRKEMLAVGYSARTLWIWRRKWDAERWRLVRRYSRMLRAERVDRATRVARIADLQRMVRQDL
jgi:hypothetical protein